MTALGPLRDRLRREGVKDWRQAHQAGAISDEVAAQILAAEAAVAEVVAVDDFAPEELTGQTESPAHRAL
ncbi:hypothetical protein D559_2969 [Bordetella holmesii 1058]|uniref:Uncharacterized protein n=1 Tax=Bordetella holmesii 1058 TaxID=1247648 RepID=A0ABP3BMB9_9BORD|nr:hypothetical protein D560_1042 [Bordetella holmesii ATCC 51541]AIT25705.1 hypothetical protein D558_1025 [Bordetella holmesii 44057]EXX95533.1 hypothetical protein D559_2969 [Bordetella holmesii 1058]